MTKGGFAGRVLHVDLTSGVYVYQITVYDRDAVGHSDQKIGKFAIIR